MIYYATSVYRPSSFLFIRRLYSSTNHLLHHFLSTPEGVQLLPSATTLSSFARGIKIRPSGCSKFRSMSASRTAASPLSCDNDVQYVTLLDGKHDDHGGAIVEMKKDMNMDKETFVSALKASLSLWSQQGKKGIWIKLPIELVHLVEPAVKEGFRYHHAEPDYMMLVHWIPETGSTIPANASHRVRIGAFVMNDCGEVLVVQEKSGKFRGTGVWKFPTGVVDEGEDICVAAVREVKEETGIDAEFVEVLAFRQSHKSYFQKSDLFFVCMLRPLSLNIKIQDLEIEAAQWMRFEEYAGQPFVESHELFRYVVKICLKKRNGGYSGFLPVPVESVFSSEKSGFLYLSKSASIDD